MATQSFFRLFKKISFIAAFTLLLFVVVVPQVHAQTAAWDSPGSVCVGPKQMNSSTDASDVATLQGLECLIGNIFTVIIGIIGLAGFVMFIVASFRYLVSGGNTKGTENARNTATFAVIGLVVALSGFIILNLLASFTGINILTKIAIPTSDSPSDKPIYSRN